MSSHRMQSSPDTPAAPPRQRPALSPPPSQVVRCPGAPVRLSAPQGSGALPTRSAFALERRCPCWGHCLYSSISCAPPLFPAVAAALRLLLRGSS
eukprot:scaffold264_cov317-Pinguiococcus_pyrenoidosus.AAC.30